MALPMFRSLMAVHYNDSCTLARPLTCCSTDDEDDVVAAYCQASIEEQMSKKRKRAFRRHRVLRGLREGDTRLAIDWFGPNPVYNAAMFRRK